MKNAFLVIGAVLGAGGIGFWIGREVGRKQEEEELAAAAGYFHNPIRSSRPFMPHGAYRRA